MIFKSLASSSAGNAYILDDGASRLLIECGVSFRKLQKALGFDVTGLCGCLVSHEHKDHCKCADKLILSGIPVWMSQGTADALELENVNILLSGEPFTICSYDILPFQVYHDASEPCGFLIRSQFDNELMVFVTDTGNFANQIKGLDIVAVECNYIREILEQSQRLPETRKKRIMTSHMELHDTIKWLRSLDLSRCREVFLLHLSDGCSNEWAIKKEVQRVCPNAKVTICEKG